MSHLLSFFLIVSLVGEPAFAKDAPQTPAADPAADAAKDVQALAGKCDLSAPNPIEIPEQQHEWPREPIGFQETNPKLQPVSAQDMQNFKFKECDRVRRARSNDKTCDTTLATIFKTFRDGNTALKDVKLKSKTKIEDKAKVCATDQTAAQKCMADIYKEVGQKFAQLAEGLHKDAAELRTHYAKHIQIASELLDKTKPAGRQLAAIADNNRAYGSNYVNFAKAADIARLRRPSEPGVCLSPMAGIMVDASPFCDRVTVAAEANFFQKKFLAAAEAAQKTAACYGQGAKTAQARADGNGNPNGNGDGPSGQSTVTGKTGSGFGLDDMMKLGTLGMTGAALYCSVSKSCSPQNQSGAQQNADPNGGATSPTPNGQNPQQEVSSLGSNGGGSGASQPAPGTPTSTAVDTGSSHGGGGGLDSALQHFNGSLDSRAPASTPATGGSSGGGGAGSGASLGGGASSSTAAATAVPDYKAPDGLGVGLGAGGLASGGGSPGGFNLGSAASASPTDNALKNILNGDAPPGLDAGLNPLADPGAGATTPQAGNDGKDDPENLFNRVRITHVRCLKRGCVGAGVGDNI